MNVEVYEIDRSGRARLVRRLNQLTVQGSMEDLGAFLRILGVIK